MIYDLFGDPVELARVATADDVRRLGPREPTDEDLGLREDGCETVHGSGRGLCADGWPVTAAAARNRRRRQKCTRCFTLVEGVAAQMRRVRSDRGGAPPKKKAA